MSMMNLLFIKVGCKRMRNHMKRIVEKYFHLNLPLPLDCVCVCVRTVHDTDRGTVKLDCLRRDQMKRFQNAQFKRN